MVEEILYHIDADNQVIGSVAKSIANSDPFFIHREVAVLLQDQSGKILIAQRSFDKKVLPGKWDITCAGHVPWGMSEEEAAHMELKEELGFDVTLRAVGRQMTFYDWETHLTSLFFGQYLGQEVTIQEEEVNDWMLASQKELEALGDDFNLEFLDFAQMAWGEEEELFLEQELDLRSNTRLDG